MNLSWDQILGGFAIFMFGIDLMGDAMKTAAGDQLREYINKYTSKPIYALFIGILLTIVMQSSSASTSITIGLVRAGLMNLEQAAGIVMGANIGTTITSFLFSINIDAYTMYFIFFGFMVRLLSKSKRMKALGVCFIGFGMIFTGLAMMGDALSEIKDMPFFASFALQMSNNKFLSLLTGTIMTAVVQASSATISVVQKMYQSNVLTLTAVLPFVFGANIGTTITGILASIGGSTAAKRTAGIHTLFNIIGTVLGMILLRPYAALITFLALKLNLNGMMQISVSHILFNTLTTIVFFPFLKRMCQFIESVIKGSDKQLLKVDVAFDDQLADSFPSAALQTANTTINHMFEVIGDSMQMSKDIMLIGKDEEEFVLQNEATIDETDHLTTSYLLKISRSDKKSGEDNTGIMIGLDTSKNLERISDLIVNLTEFNAMIKEDKANLSDDAKSDIDGMFDHLSKMLTLSQEVFNRYDVEKAMQLEILEDSLDNRETKAREAHFARMSRNECKSAVAASVYCDILSNMERIGDHCMNIARSHKKYHIEEKTQ